MYPRGVGEGGGEGREKGGRREREWEGEGREKGEREGRKGGRKREKRGRKREKRVKGVASGVHCIVLHNIIHQLRIHHAQHSSKFTSSCGSFFLKNEDRTGTRAHQEGQPHTALCCETSRNDSLDRTKGTFSSAAIS